MALTLAGFNVVASDIVDHTLDEARRLFPELQTRYFDVLHPSGDEMYDDVLIAALDYALDDAQLESALANVCRYMRPGGRVVLVLRYRSTPAMWLIDRALLPAWAALRRRRGHPLRRRPQRYRRSVREVLALAQRSGYRANVAGHAGYAAELARIWLDLKAPRLYDLARRMNERVPMLNTATVLVLESRQRGLETA